MARARKGVSFGLEAGRCMRLLGENGAGKSTLIRVMTGAYSADGGTMEVNGEDVSELTPAAARELAAV